MDKIIEEWKYDLLPAKAKENITTQYTIGHEEYKKKTSAGLQEANLEKGDKKLGEINLFNSFNGEEEEEKDIENVETDKNIDEVESKKITLKDLNKSTIIWATDSYINSEGKHHFKEPLSNFNIIRPRTEKTLEEQKKRVKDKAEVFTPSWVCNLQNNLIDNEILGKNSFNKVTDDNKEWRSSVKVKFKNEYKWTTYILEKRLEVCCGEGPYLFSRYDTTTGENIPVRTIKNGRSDWRRIGILDRKLRVVSENTENIDDWITAAKIALQNTYGFEWQGDNLFLARMNMLNTFFDYYHDYVKNTLKVKEKDLKISSNNLCVEVTEIISKQLWQMDGLKFVIPDTCSTNCESCKKKLRTDHDGEQPVFNWGGEYRTFEHIYKINQ